MFYSMDKQSFLTKLTFSVKLTVTRYFYFQCSQAMYTSLHTLHCVTQATCYQTSYRAPLRVVCVFDSKDKVLKGKSDASRYMYMYAKTDCYAWDT